MPILDLMLIGFYALIGIGIFLLLQTALRISRSLDNVARLLRWQNQRALELAEERSPRRKSA